MKNNRFARWFYGEEDTLLDKVEMRPQHPREPSTPEVEALQREHDQLHTHIYEDDNRKLWLFEQIYRIAAVLFCLVFISIMLVAVSWLPPAGSPANPGSNEVSARYIAHGLQETGATNIVTGMILDYRAFDTFGESNVLFVATVAVLILMRLDGGPEDALARRAAQEEDERLFAPRHDAILQKVAALLVPMIFLFGIYVILNGHLSPGGGFSGGAILGAGLILYLNAFGFARIHRFFTEKTYRWVCFFALSFYCLAKSYSFFTGANHLESGIPLGTPGAILSGGLILPLNICVGLVVACTMYAFYALFRKGGF